MGKFTAEATEEQKQAMVAAILGMANDIAEIVSVSAGIDCKLDPERNSHFCATVDFKDESDYKVYASHPAHVAVINGFIKPILQPGSRAASQFKLA